MAYPGKFMDIMDPTRVRFFGGGLPVLAVLLIFAGFLTFTAPPPVSAMDVNPAPIDSLFREYDRSDAPGCAVAVYKNGATRYSGAFGIANLDYGVSLSDNSRFYMTSLAQQITAAAAGLLIIRGDLDPDARVSTYIKNWPDWAADVRINHLMRHTSGLPDLYDLMDIAGISINNVMSLDDYVALIKSGEPLMFRPGSRRHISNSGYTILAKIVEVVTGDDFAKFAKREILEPLKMTSTHFHDDRYRNIPDRVISYKPVERSHHTSEYNTSNNLPETTFRQTYPGNYQGVGPGGLYATIGDWGRWEAFRLGNSGYPAAWQERFGDDLPEDYRDELPDVIREEIPQEFRNDLPPELDEVRLLLMDRTTVQGDTVSNGIAHEHTTWHGQKRESQSGSFHGFRADLRRYPDHGLATLVLCNRADADPEAKNRSLARILLREPLEAYLQQYAGVYHNEELQVDYELAVEDGALILNRRLDPKGEMTEEAPGKWSAGSWDFVFLRDDVSGGVTGFVISTGRAREVKFLRK